MIKWCEISHSVLSFTKKKEKRGFSDHSVLVKKFIVSKCSLQKWVFSERLHNLVIFFFFCLYILILKLVYFSTEIMGPDIFIVQSYSWAPGAFFMCLCVSEQRYGLVKVFIEYCHKLTLSYWQ